MANITYTVPAIHCEGCAGSIKRSLGKLSGVQEVMVDVAKKMVTVMYDAEQTNQLAITERLALVGFPVK